jgi:hypothetical protein
MRFFNRGSNGLDNRGNRGNRGRGPNAFWQRGRNKRMRFSIHFDANSEEFNQLVQTGYLNLAGHPTFHPHQPQVRPPFQPNDLQPHLSIVDILDQPQMQPQPPVNDGWNNAPVQSSFWCWSLANHVITSPSSTSFTTSSSVALVASHVHSPQAPKKLQSLSY